MEPLFLTLDELLAIHSDQIERYGGQPGLRDMGLLLSAVAMPHATFDGQYLHQDLASMAAAYLFHLVANHAFIDGNKRVGAAAAVVFLEMNGIDFNTPEDEYEQLVLAIAKGETDKSAAAEFFRRII